MQLPRLACPKHICPLPHTSWHISASNMGPSRARVRPRLPRGMPFVSPMFVSILLTLAPFSTAQPLQPVVIPGPNPFLATPPPLLAPIPPMLPEAPLATPGLIPVTETPAAAQVPPLPAPAAAGAALPTPPSLPGAQQPAQFAPAPVTVPAAAPAVVSLSPPPPPPALPAAAGPPVVGPSAVLPAVPAVEAVDPCGCTSDGTSAGVNTTFIGCGQWLVPEGNNGFVCFVNVSI